jgi:hypothetical protein
MRPQPIDRAALTRQFLAAAVGGVVDTGLPQLTPVDARLPQHAIAQNEPTAPAQQPTPFRTATKKPTHATTIPAPSGAPAVDAGLRQLTPVDVSLPVSHPGKTKPPSSPPVAALSSRQLAAARLLACGRCPAEVAAELGITRQALWKWRRRADFAAEVFRLHECLVWTAGAARRPTAIQRSMA